jgi:peptidyl-prolyl cis-trans isomerase D
LKVETAAAFKRDGSPTGVPSATISAAFRTAKDGVGQTPGSGGSEWIVFRVTDITVPPVDLSADDMKRLKETLERAMTDEQVAQYVTRLEKDIGTSINEAAFAQVTGANN